MSKYNNTINNIDVEIGGYRPKSNIAKFAIISLFIIGMAFMIFAAIKVFISDPILGVLLFLLLMKLAHCNDKSILDGVIDYTKSRINMLNVRDAWSDLKWQWGNYGILGFMIVYYGIYPFPDQMVGLDWYVRLIIIASNYVVSVVACTVLITLIDLNIDRKRNGKNKRNKE